MERNKVIVENASDHTPAECIENFLEAKTDLTVESIIPGESKGSFEVVFTAEPDIDDLEKLFMKRTIDDSYLTVRRMLKPVCILVTALDGRTTKDNIEFYFENKKKSDGAEVKSVTLSEDGKSAIVEFGEPEVAERVCKRKHRINDKDVTVTIQKGRSSDAKPNSTPASNMHHTRSLQDQQVMKATAAGASLQFTKRPNNNEMPQSKSLDIQPKNQPDKEVPKTTAKSVKIQKLCPQLVLFLKSKKLYKARLSQFVSENNGQCTFIQQSPTKVLLVVTFRGEDIGYENWSQSIESDIVGFVTECLNLTTELVFVPEGALRRVYTKINPLLEKHQTLVFSTQGDTKSEIIVTGDCGKVETIKVEITKAVKDIEDLPLRKEACTLRMPQIHYLIITKFAEKYPQVKIDMTPSSGSVVFEGPCDDVEAAKIECLHLVQNLVVETITYKVKEILKLLDSPQTSEFIHNKLRHMSCVWESDSTKATVKVYADSQAAADEGKETVKRCLSDVSITLNKASEKLLDKSEWKEKKRELLDKYKGKLEFVREKKALVIVSTSDISDEVKTEIEQFLDDQQMRTQSVLIEAPVARFVRSFKIKAIQKIEADLLEHQVTIVVDEGIVSNEVKISGFKDGFNKAEKFVKDMLSKILTKQHQITLPGIEHFFVKGKGRDLLFALGQKEECVIEPQDLSRLTERKSVRCWEVQGAGALSVIHGDMRDLKVDAIVNAANRDLQHAGGVAKAIVDRGGSSIQKESDNYIKSYGPLSDAEVVDTSAGKLPCKMILHAVGPIWSGGNNDEKETLENTIRNILKAANKHRLHSVAIPTISTGIFGYPLQDAVEVILKTLLSEWQSGSSSVKEVFLCDIKLDTVKVLVDVGDELFGEGNGEASASAGAGAVDDDSSSEDESVIQEEEDGHRRSGTDSESSSDEELNTTVVDYESPGIRIVKGELASTRVDVIVNPADCDLDLSAGAVSRSLLKAGGPDLQEECNDKYDNGILHGEVAITKGGNLPCKAVFHGLLMKWNQGKGKAEQILRNLVTLCLEKADEHEFASVAFPALGTGKQRFPADISAEIMFHAARNYLNSVPHTSVETILFVIRGGEDRAVYKAFKQQESCSHGNSYDSRPSSSRHHGSRGNRSFDHSTDTTGSSFNVSRLSVEVVEGDITKERTDCVVNSCKESCDLSYSAISKALSRAAGPGLQKECYSKRSDMSKYSFILTSGGHLQCKTVAHLKIQTSDGGWKYVITKCMELLNKKRFKSMSIPALGTGGLKQSPEKMAGVLREAIETFGANNARPYLTNVRVVIFQREMVKSFQSVFAGRTSRPMSARHGRRDRGHSGRGHRGEGHRRSRRREEEEDVLDMSNKHLDDKVTLCIYTDDKKKMESVKTSLTKLCKEEYDQKPLSDTWNDFIKQLKNKEVSALFKIANDNGVALTRTTKGLTLTGLVKHVSAAYELIMEKLLVLQKTAQQQEEARTVAKLVEWSYVTEKGQSRAFGPGLNCKLEKAKNEKQSKIDFEDNKGRKYTIDLDKMEEYSVDGGPTVAIRRIEKGGGSSGLGKYVDGERAALKGTSTVYFPLVPERNFKGTAEELHFRTAESQFYRLLSGHGQKFKVDKVEYIVNPSLVKKFQSAQEALKKSRGEKDAQPVLAFHGTNVTNIPKICDSGFLKAGDPGFQMKSGNAFGNGVYFSEFPDYSMSYISGATKLLLCKVLLGKTWTITTGKLQYMMSGSGTSGLQAGYDSHTSPCGKELIIFNTDRILPCYVVHYS